MKQPEIRDPQIVAKSFDQLFQTFEQLDIRTSLVFRNIFSSTVSVSRFLVDFHTAYTIFGNIVLDTFWAPIPKSSTKSKVTHCKDIFISGEGSKSMIDRSTQNAQLWNWTADCLYSMAVFGDWIRLTRATFEIWNWNLASNRLNCQIFGKYDFSLIQFGLF